MILEKDTLRDKDGIYTVHHFVDSNNLRVGISSQKKRQKKNGAQKQRIETPLHTCIGVSRKFHSKPMFFCFLVRKKEQLLKALRSFLSRLFAQLWLKFEERYTLRLLSMSLEEGGVLEVVLPGRGQMTYLGKEKLALGTGGKEKPYRLTIK